MSRDGAAGDGADLPDPETVVAETREASTDGAVNLAVAGAVDADSVELADDGYVGDSAGVVGRLAAALAVDDAALHYPEPDFTADGPWLVLAPLSGVASTVAKGTGRAVVSLDYDASDDPTLDRLDERVSDLLDAARPSHDHYPVESDEQGAFTTGLTTFALDSLSVESSAGETLDGGATATSGGATATFDVSTTPATRPSEVRARFADVAGVEDVAYEPVAGVERAAPSPELRDAVEAAHRRVVGDCEYDWLPGPGAFATIPGAEKMALGTGTPGADEFSREQYETCVDLLRSTLSNLGVSA